MAAVASTRRERATVQTAGPPGRRYLTIIILSDKTLIAASVTLGRETAVTVVSVTEGWTGRNLNDTDLELKGEKMHWSAVSWSERLKLQSAMATYRVPLTE